jgi:predicted porin
MKKSLFALAAVTAFAGAAQAQSSVTVYGILDVGFASGYAKSGATKTTSSLFDQSRETSSRLGFRGTEDLGGGLSAFFTFETGLNPTGATLSSFNNRQAFVGLRNKGMGAVSLGNQYTVEHNAIVATDPGASNNVTGSIIRPAGPVTDSGQGALSNAYVVQSTNMIMANSDSFAGFRGNAMYVSNGTDTTQRASGTTNASNGGNTNYSGWGLSADYTWKKLYVTAAYQSFKNTNDNGVQTLTAAQIAAGAGTGVTAATLPNTTDNGTYVGASYDFGVLKAFAGWIDRKLTSNLDSNNYLKRTGQQIGVRSFITPKIEGWASGGSGRYDAYGPTTPTANFTAWQLGSNYYLSKRTNLYGIYGVTQTSSTSGTAASAASQFAVGVRHTF